LQYNKRTKNATIVIHFPDFEEIPIKNPGIKKNPGAPIIKKSNAESEIQAVVKTSFAIVANLAERFLRLLYLMLCLLISLIDFI